MKKFIRKTLFIALPILLLMVAVNYFGDAAQLFNDSYIKKMAAILQKGKYVTNIANYDERLFQKIEAENSKSRYDVLIIGSSRTMLINSDDFKGQKVYNCSVSGASIEDLVAIYQMYKAKKLLPKKILFGVDPWIFNKNNDQKRWESVNDVYKSFFKGGKVIEVNPGTGNNKYLQLISPSYFQSSLKNIPGFIKGKAKPQSTTQAYNKTNTKLTDGSLAYGKAYREASPAEIDRKVQDYLTGSIYSIEDYDSLSGDAIKIFNMLMSDCQKNNIDVEFILQPYNPAVYQVISRTHPTILRAQDYIRSYAAANHIKVYGDYDPQKLNLDKTYFFDGMHDKYPAIKKILGIN